jgi:hypothetical protein
LISGLHTTREHEHGGQEREHPEDLDRELDVRLRGEGPRVAEHQHERREAEKHAEHARASCERGVDEEEIQDD